MWAPRFVPLPPASRWVESVGEDEDVRPAGSQGTLIDEPMPTPIWVTIPTYNEIDGLELMRSVTADGAEQTAPGQWKWPAVDDSSPDAPASL